jgi:glycosyltransferase involved in cell wall biosynthesis
MRAVYLRADAIIAISGAVKEWLHDDLRICADKVTVIHYGIEAEQFADSNRRRRKTGQQRAVVGSLGRLEPGKGFDCLIRAMQIVHKQIPAASLLIAGHDPLGYGKRLKELIVKLSLTEQVHLIGFQNDVPAFLCSIDVFALASHSEGFGQVVIEAMAAGKPVVASRIPPLTEIVVDGETGRLVERRNPNAFAEALAYLLMDPLERKRMGAEGQVRIKEYFTAERMSRETLSLYEHLRDRRSVSRSIA